MEAGTEFSSPASFDDLLSEKYLTASTNDFPEPPSEESLTKPEPEMEEDIEEIMKNLEDLSFNNPLANVQVPIGNSNAMSDDEGDMDFTDADAAIDKMLDDLQDFQDFLGPDSTDGKKDNFAMRTPKKTKEAPPLPISTEALDHLRFSMGNFEETPEVDLDALLEDLCIMERDIKESSNIGSSNSTLDSMNTNSSADITEFQPNSPSYKMTSPVMVTHDVKERLENLQNELESKELTPEEQEDRIKAEKMKIALEKMKAASFQKLFIKVLNKNKQTSKTMMIDQTWTARDVTQKMITKDNEEMHTDWCIMEKLPDLNMERILEDHEYILPIVLDWPRETNNLLVFIKRRDKYTLFKNPQNFLLTNLNTEEDAKLAEKSKDLLLDEFFTKENTQIPQVEGVLSVKKGNKKWDRHYVVLRASGIYYNPKGKQKTREVSCLVQFEHNNPYLGVSYKKRFKAPTDHVICLKHQKIQNIKSKHICSLCAEDSKTMYIWMTGIRMAKYGFNMYEDYLITRDEVERVLLGGSRSLEPSISIDEPSTHPTSTNGTVAEKYRTIKGGTVRNQIKNPDGTVQRIKGKMNALAEIFSNAWEKGIAETQNGIVSPDLHSPTTPADMKSPGITPKTFGYSVETTTHGTTGERLVLDPAPIGRNGSKKNKKSNLSDTHENGLFNKEESATTNGQIPAPPSPPPPPPPNNSQQFWSNEEPDNQLPPPPPDLSFSNPELPPPPPDLDLPPPIMGDNSYEDLPPPPDFDDDMSFNDSYPSIDDLYAKPIKPKKNAPPPPPPLSAKPGRAENTEIPQPPPPPQSIGVPPPPPLPATGNIPPPPPPLNMKPGRT